MNDEATAMLVCAGFRALMGGFGAQRKFARGKPHLHGDGHQSAPKPKDGRLSRGG